MIRLAVDIDQTLTMQCAKFKEIAERYGITDHSYLQEYDGIWKTYDKDNVQLAVRIFKDHLDEFLLDSKPIEGTREAFEKLVASPHIKPYIVTSRRESTKELTLRWLKEHGYNGAEDVLFLDDKLKADCNCLVDDHYKHVKAYTDNARLAFMIDAPYNKKHNAFRRITHLSEVHEHLLKFI